MADTVQLVLVIHNHQPVGNFDYVIDQACERAYLPFLRTLLDFPDLRIGLHTSGCLLEWLETRRPEYFELVRELLSRGQLELLGGAMQEPILPVIPQVDAQQQMAALQYYLSRHFGVWPSGMWTPERVWEPQLAQLIGFYYRYTLLDDYHFEGNALPQQLAREYFSTDFEGQGIALLPISRKLRYTIPFRPVSESINHLRDLMTTSEQPPLVVFGDDGEKFGVWPDTHDWVYTQGWLRDFFSALSENQDWIRLLLPAEVLAQRAPAARAYIPCRSYKEMDEWARIDPDAPADSASGHWRNFLAKYPEVYDFYRRMCSVSRRVAIAGGETDQEHFARAQAALMRAQCNCAYWHGVFGGLYLNYLRAALTRNLLEAEALCGSFESSTSINTPQQQSRRRMMQLAPWQHEGLGELLQGGTNLEGQPQLLAAGDNAGAYARLPFVGARLRVLDDNWTTMQIETETAALQQQMDSGVSDFLLEDAGNLCAWLDGARGLCLRRLDYYPSGFCWTDVLARRREQYHHKVEDAGTHTAAEHGSIHERVQLKEDGLERRLVVDPHQRVSFVTYFGSFQRAEQFLWKPEPGEEPPAGLQRDFHLTAALQLLPGPRTGLSGLVQHGSFALRKSVRINSGHGLELCVELAQGQAPQDQGLLWLEFNFTVLTDVAEDRFLELNRQRNVLNRALQQEGIRQVALVDQWQQRRLDLNLQQDARLLTYPVYTVSSSEGGFERTYQGTCIMLGYPPAALREGVSILLSITALGGQE